MPRSRTLPALTGLALAVGSLAVTLVAAQAAAVPGADSSVFVNEIHYDNANGDVGEFVEIANTTGADLTGWSCRALQRLATERRYRHRSRSAGNRRRSRALTYPVDGVQNGSPDARGAGRRGRRPGAVPLLRGTDDRRRQGRPIGETSTDIGVAETATTPVGQSLQLTGERRDVRRLHVDWAGGRQSRVGQHRPDLRPVAGRLSRSPTAVTARLAVDTDEIGSRDVSAVDADSQIVSAEITSAQRRGHHPRRLHGVHRRRRARHRDPAPSPTRTADGTYPVEIEFATDDDPAQTATCTVTVAVSDQDAVCPDQRHPG